MIILLSKACLDTDYMQQNKENNFLTFPTNDTRHAEEKDRNKYSVKYWYHDNFIISGKFILSKCFVCIPRDNFHVY